MSDYQQKDNTGAAFPNKDKKESKHPDFKGTVLVDGKEKQIAIWSKKSKAGNDYFSIAISEPFVPTTGHKDFQPAHKESAPSGQIPDTDSEIPF